MYKMRIFGLKPNTKNVHNIRNMETMAHLIHRMCTVCILHACIFSSNIILHKHQPLLSHGLLFIQYIRSITTINKFRFIVAKCKKKKWPNLLAVLMQIVQFNLILNNTTFLTDKMILIGSWSQCANQI